MQLGPAPKPTVRAAELQAKAKVATPTASASQQTATDYAAALRQALDTVQQHHQPQASSEGEAMEQDELPPPVAPPEQEEREAETEDKVVRPPRGQCPHGCNKDASCHSSIDRPVKAVAKGPTEDGQQVSVALRAAGGHAPPGPELKTMPHQDPSVFHPEANYNREAFPPPLWHIPQGRAQHLTTVPEQMPPAWHSQTHADLPVYLERLQGVARMSRDAFDSGLLQS